MTDILSDLSGFEMALAFLVALVAGTVKGLVGFAMPMLLISGLNMFLPPEVALAGLILPTLVANVMQVLPQGLSAAWSSVVRFRRFLVVAAVCLAVSAQLVRFLPPSAMFLMIGAPITLFAALQLSGYDLRLRNPSGRTEAAVAAFAGFIGGFSGVWGPPTVAYLTALNTPKSEQMRIQGVIYGLGSVALLFAHIGSGVLTRQTAPFSLALVAPAVLGMLIGQRWHAQVDQATFRKFTLVVLLLAGVNLMRRALL